MGPIVFLLHQWQFLVSYLFTGFPLFGALVTLLCVGIFFHFEKTERPGETPTNILIALLSWMAIVPLVGIVLGLLVKVWLAVASVLPFIVGPVAAFLAVYDRHPFMVLALIVVATSAYFWWKLRRPRVLPWRWVRVALLGAATVLLALALDPVANRLRPVPSADLYVPYQPASTPSAVSAPSTP